MTARRCRGSGEAAGRAPARPWRPALLIVLAGVWLAGPANVALWHALGGLGLLDGVRGAAFALAFGIALAALHTLLLALLAWRATLKPALAFLLLAAAAAGWFMVAYGVVIDTPMIVNVLQTNPREAADLMTPRFALAFGLGGVLPAALVWRLPVHYGPWTRRLAANGGLAMAALAVAALALLAAFQPLSSAMRNHKHLRYLINPLNTLYALGDLAAEPLKRQGGPLRPLGEDARPGPAGATAPRPPLLLLVLGETARTQNFGLNGYARDTTPQLARRRVLSFRDVTACGTSTAASVPCLFSHLGRVGFDGRDADHETLLDVVQRAGLAVLWLDNQSGCKGVCDRVPHADTDAKAHAALCPDGECLDEVLLDGLDARLAALPAERRARGVLLVMHQMGSHGPAYFKRSPPASKRFGPECTSAALQDCTREQVVAAYDNSIAYTDLVLARTIDWLASQPAYAGSLLYLSDHGESLGENNLYLHGLPYALAPDTQTRVPWIAWFSPGYAAWRGLSVDCLRGRLDAPLSHDHLFHTVLGALDIATAVYKPALDAYAPCRH